MAKKKVHADGTYMISPSSDNPRIGSRLVADGKESLFLDYYMGLDENKKRIRKREKMNLHIYSSPRTPDERNYNNQVMELAKRVRYEREQQMKEGMLDYYIKDTNLHVAIRAYINNYTKADIRMIRMAYNRFCAFLSEQYPQFVQVIPPKNVSPRMISQFVDYLRSHCRGEGASTIYSRFKKIIKQLTREHVFRDNPCDGISCPAEKGLVKAILSMEEVGTLINYTPEWLNEDVRRAFIFTLYTGIRFCDVKDLTHSNVDRANALLRFQQAKTSHSSASWVTIPLNEWLFSLIGEGKGEERIFALPSHDYCIRAVKRWVKEAGIDKHITWHCARHSFAVNILNNGANIKTVSSLLGHSSLKHTEKYLHAVDKLRVDAINSLPTFEQKKEGD